MGAGDFVQLSDVQMDFAMWVQRSLYCQFRNVEMSAEGGDFVENAAHAVKMSVTTIRTFLSLRKVSDKGPMKVTNFSWKTNKKSQKNPHSQWQIPTGARDMCPLSVEILSFSCQKCCKIIGWHPPGVGLGSWIPLLITTYKNSWTSYPESKDSHKSASLDIYNAQTKEK